MAEQEDFEIDDTAKEGGSKKLIFIIGGVVLLLIIAGGAFFFLSSGDDAASESVDAAEHVEEVKPAQYQSFDQPLVVNFESGGPVKLLQADIEVMSREGDAIDAFTLHRPMIRNNLMLLLAKQDYKKISTPEGKEELRQAMLDEINKILKERGSKQSIEQVFYTKFVMQ
jgi:flagellar FliL protein